MELREIQACLRAGIEDRATKVGPFLVLINAQSDNVFRNYAVPVDGAEPTDADVTALIEYFAGRDRMPRLEYVRPAPAVDGPLRAAGFGVTDTLTLMALDGELPAAPDAPGYHVRLVTDEAELRQVAAVQDTAYGEAEQEPDPGGLLRTVRDGGRVALAVETATGAPAGGGMYSDPQGGLVEIAAIGVLPAHRRRGVGGLVSWALTAEAVRRGHRPFLQVERDEPLRVYQRIGYRVIGDMADARRPAPVDRPVPVLAADERDTMLVFLDYVRTGLINKLVGVTGLDARQAMVPSGTSLLWLVKHTMAMEGFWLHHVFGGQPESALADDELADQDSPASVIERYRELAVATAELVGRHPDLGELGAVAPFGGPRRSLRWTLVHLIEETGRHAGHADILRELLDGATGR